MLQLAMKLPLFLKNLWTFPILLFVLVCGLALFRISGSSIGVYEQILNGSSSSDKNLIWGKPRGIRSDEAAIVTQLTISQARTDFKRVNPLVGLGEDMSVIGDFPYREWSEFFKPQNWAFFVLPLEQAFAFKWWFLGWTLITSCYILLQTLLPERRRFNILLSLSVFFTPFIQWWYQSITILSLAYGFLICALLIHLTKPGRRRTRLLLTGALVYVLIAFALLLYPPFQIACLLGIVAVYFGCLLARGGSAKHWVQGLKWPVAASLVAMAVIGIFFFTRLPIINAITGTSYPGHRVVASGGFKVGHFFSGPFLGVMQSDKLAEHYDMNQSEASNFIMLWPVLLIPSLYIILKRREHKQPPPYMLLAINAMLMVMAARIFLPMPMVLAKVLLLASVPHQRLFVGMGLLGIVQIGLLAREKLVTLPHWVVMTTSFLALGLFLIVGIHLRHLFPGLLPHRWMIYVPCLVVAVSVWGLLSRRPEIGAAGLLLIGLGTSAMINPLYRGLSPIIDSKLSRALQQMPNTHDGSEWILLGGGSFTNYLPAQGIPSYSTTYLYPQLDLWHRYDPSGRYSAAYNRYANMGFVINPDIPQFASGSADSFVIRYDPCDMRFADIKHVMAVAPTASACLRETNQVHEPNVTFYLYDATPAH